jgi:hypothetical protein
VAKCLKLVAPAAMDANQQTAWLASAVDALVDIRANEISAISVELRRKVSRPAQIVPEIANLVAQRRERSSRSIDLTPVKTLEVPREPSPPLSAQEIEGMPKWLRDIGLRVGFLTKRDGRLVDTAEA